MFIVRDIYNEGKKIMGSCSDEQFFAWCADTVSMIANKLDLEGWKLYLDICTAGCSCSSGGQCRTDKTCGRRCVTLPREVQTVQQVLIGGEPALGFDQTFAFHLNGPGKCRQTCDWSWIDAGAWHCTYRDLITPAQLVVYSQFPEDNGKMFIVYGYDANGNKLRREECNQWMDGIRLPVIYGYAIPDSTAPFVARITGILKDETVGSLRLATTDSSGNTGVNLGVYEPDERVPQFRRIILNRSCDWVRISAIKSNPSFSSQFDRVPMQSRLAFLIGLQARKYYAAYDIASAHASEADAARLEFEAQSKLDAPLYAPMQFVDRSQSLKDRSDYDIR